MKKNILEAQLRTVIGKKVKALRRNKLIPANIYGKKITSQAIQVVLNVFEKVYKEAGETQLIDLRIDSETRPVLIKNVQLHPVTHHVLHADFFQVDLKEKITAQIPLELVGEAPAVVENVGVLLRLLDEITVEALPDKLPEKIEVDVSKLAAVGEVIKLADVTRPPSVEFITPPETELVRVDELVSKEAEALVKEEAAAVEAAAAAQETTEEGKETKEVTSPETKAKTEPEVKAPAEK